MQIEQEVINDLKLHFNITLSKINYDVVSSRKRCSVIYRLSDNAGIFNISVGAMSKAGSYLACYDQNADVKDYVSNIDTKELFQKVFDKFKIDYPNRSVLYVRYNAKKDLVEMFYSSNGHIKSKVL